MKNEIKKIDVNRENESEGKSCNDYRNQKMKKRKTKEKTTNQITGIKMKKKKYGKKILILLKTKRKKEINENKTSVKGEGTVE